MACTRTLALISRVDLPKRRPSETPARRNRWIHVSPWQKARASSCAIVTVSLYQPAPGSKTPGQSPAPYLRSPKIEVEDVFYAVLTGALPDQISHTRRTVGMQVEHQHCGHLPPLLGAREQSSRETTETVDVSPSRPRLWDSSLTWAATHCLRQLWDGR